MLLELKVEEWTLELYVPAFIPIISCCQAFLLNKIEIGQFLYMKYKVGTDNKVPTIKIDEIKSLTSFQWVSSMEPTHTVTANIKSITQNNCLGNLFIKFCPSLFRNILSSVYLTLLHLAIKYGTNNIVIQDDIKLTTLLCNNSSSNITIKTLKTTPDQNIKFQKLSLFSRDLIQFITNLKFSILKSMISWFTILSKAIIKILVVIIFSFSQNITFAQDLSELITMVEKEHNIPSGLLKAIVEVESGLKAYAVNVAGKAFIAKSQVDAVKIIRSYLKKGHTNIDIGLAQINWHWHGCNFSSINEMLTPKNNLKYAAKLLTDLYGKHGDWQKVVRLYHSAKPHHHRQYSRKVLLSWLDDSDGT